MSFQYNDGGRSATGRKGTAGDCVCRAITIAAGLPYDDVYRELANRRAATGKAKSARQGIARSVYEAYLRELGFKWVPTMGFGTGCQVHLRADELPAGRIIARLSRHLCAVIDGTVHDIYDPSRDGTRCVYGYFTKG